MPVKNILFCFFIVLILSFVFSETKAQKPVSASDTPVSTLDSLTVAADSIVLAADTIPPKSPNAIDAPVYYQSKDSIVMVGTNFIYLFGEGNVKYQNLELNADYIEVDTDKSIVYATFSTDSIGDEIGYPIFKEGQSQYEAKTMRYNFKTKKGFSTDVITQQGEGFVTAGRTKKLANDDMFMVDGKYTTCEDHDHPHFYFNLTRAKVRPGKNIVTGPAYLVVEDVPLPIAIPFGYFPFRGDYSSGIIMPSYGDELRRGFSLRNGGYYFAFNDYMDLALTGEIHTRGSWGINARSAYNKRYKYSGSFALSYIATVLGDKGEPDYMKSTDFSVKWNHRQDTKANPFRTLSANVDFSTTSYDRHQVNGFASGNQNRNQKMSSVALTQNFPDSPWSLNMNMSASQRTQDSTLTLALPTMNIAMRQIFPFKRKIPIGGQRWYEAISVSYQGNLENKYSGKERYLSANILDDWQNGMKHSIPVSATFNLFNYINISPGINYNERWHTKKVTQDYNADKGRLVPIDTVSGFFRSYDYSASISMNTKLYGFFTPWKIFGDKVQKIRHVLTPTVSFSGSPDFSDPRYGSHVDKTFIDRNGNIETIRYSPFSFPGAMFPPSGGGKSGSLNFSVNNNVEMKVKSDRDSTGVRKISLIDQLSFGSGYNFMLDSLNWSNISANLRINAIKSFPITVSGTFEVYMYDENARRINKLRWNNGKFPRFTGTSYSQSYTLNNETFKKWFGKKDSSSDSDNKTGENDKTNVADDNQDGARTNAPLRSGKRDRGNFDDDGYAIFTIPWNLSFNYSVNWRYGDFDKVRREFNYKLSHTLSISGNIQPTKGWRFNMNTSYNFDRNRFEQMLCTVSRDLHCWSMSASFNPIGYGQFYNFTLSVNSSMLKDLKYDQRNSFEPSRWE